MYNVFIKKRKIRRYVVRPKSRGKDNISVSSRNILGGLYVTNDRLFKHSGERLNAKTHRISS